MNSKVSIIVPVYNMQNTVRKCLTSICQQTYINLEIIIINDGSTDNSDEIITEFASRDDRIIYKSRDNKGLSMTYKEGVDLASGEWILFVDSDDYIDINLVEELINKQKETKADIVQGGIKFLNESYIEISKSQSTNISIKNKKELLYNYFITGKINTTFASCLIRISLFSNIVFYDRALSIDLEVMPYILSKCSIFVQIGEPFYNAIQFQNSVSRGFVSEPVVADRYKCNSVLDSFFDLEAPDLKEYMFYRRAMVASTLYMKIKYGNSTLNNCQDVIKQCMSDFKKNYNLFVRSSIEKDTPRKKKTFMRVFNISPSLLNLILRVYRKHKKISL